MFALISAVIVLLLGAGLALAVQGNRWRAGWAIATQLVATVLVLSAAWPVLMGGVIVSGSMVWTYPVGTPRVQMDGLGAFFLVWSLPMTLLGSLYAVGYMRRYFDSARHLGVHFALLNFTALSFILVYCTDHALIFLLGWEIAALAAWQLVIWDFSNQKVRFAGFNYLVSTHIGLIFLVAAIMIMYAHTGTWGLDSMGAWLQTHPGPERNLVFLLLLISFGLKSAFFPFHSWLPRAHAAAPAHVSALMSGVIHKAGLYALVRFVLLIGQPDEWMGWFLIAFAACSALVGGLYTVGQRDLKRMLGYSSTENVGIAGIGIGVGCLGLTWGMPALVALGFAGGLLHVLNHAFFKCQLFYAAGAVYQGTHTVDMEKLGGLARLLPWTTLFFLVGGVAISALPPLNGFTSEFTIYSALFQDGALPPPARVALILTAAVLAFVGAMSAMAITRTFGVVFLGAPRDAAIDQAAEANRWMLLPMGVHSLGVVVLGLAPFVGLMMVAEPTSLAMQTLGVSATPLLADIADQLGMVSTVSACLLIGFGALFQLRRWWMPVAMVPHVTWGCGYTAVSPRMQYTGAAFWLDFGYWFRSILLILRRRKAPVGYFPTDSYAITDCVDAVERRMYAVIGHGDESAENISRKLPEDDTRVTFAAGLIAVVLIVGLALLTSGVRP
ncbi:MAG: proton-conducting membrane transporter [Betaproteobacteria bacterium]|nr:proton-conducting membrane transporter [Betaproteobacteria bacterium]